MSTRHEADTLGAIVTNDRDRRTLAWLRAKVGDDTIRETAASLPGQRRPYLSNIARAIGLVLPASLAQSPAGSAVRAEVARHLEALRATTARPRRTAGAAFCAEVPRDWPA